MTDKMQDFDRYMEELFRQSEREQPPDFDKTQVYRPVRGVPEAGRPPEDPYRAPEPVYRPPQQNFDPVPAQPQPAPALPPARRPRRRKRRRRVRTLLIVLVILAAALFAAWKLLVIQPKTDAGSLGARRSGVSTILLAGTDLGGTRTDTIILACIDKRAKTVNLLSIPRDTLVPADMTVPKINGVYGWYGGGADGMEALMDQVRKLIGFRPDGYALVDLDAFVDVVDLMGGVEFDVPQDMFYVDPGQDLTIDLAAGRQLLNGRDAMGLVRFRSGYALADLERVNVQRDFVKAAMDQWVSPRHLAQLPKLLSKVGDSVTSDLTRGNILWLATAILRSDLAHMTTQTLPGRAIDWNGSYYQADPQAVAELISSSFNPYKTAITADMLQIRTVY